MKLAHLRSLKKTPLIYVFAFCYQMHWTFIIIGREELEEICDLYSIGSITKEDHIWFRFKFFDETGIVTCSGYDFTEFLDWEKVFPDLAIRANPPNRRHPRSIPRF